MKVLSEKYLLFSEVMFSILKSWKQKSPNIWNIPKFFEQHNLNFLECLLLFKNVMYECENLNSYSASSRNFSEMASKWEQRLYYDLDIKCSPWANVFAMLDPNGDSI